MMKKTFVREPSHDFSEPGANSWADSMSGCGAESLDWNVSRVVFVHAFVWNDETNLTVLSHEYDFRVPAFGPYVIDLLSIGWAGAPSNA